CYVVANYTYSGIGGDKTQPTQGNYDYWFAKFCDTSSTTSFQEIIKTILIKVNPNPFTSTISITIQNSNFRQASLTIKNVLGQTEFNLQENNINMNYPKEINLGFLSKGLYFLELNIDGVRTVKKI